jgi:hypothetical protein
VLLAEFHIVPRTRWQRPLTFEVGGRQDQQTAELMLIEIPDRVDEVSIESHNRSGDL